MKIFRKGIVGLLFLSFIPLIGYSIYLSCGEWSETALVNNKTFLIWWLGVVALYGLSILLGCWKDKEETR